MEEGDNIELKYANSTMKCEIPWNEIWKLPWKMKISQMSLIT